MLKSMIESNLKSLFGITFFVSKRCLLYALSSTTQEHVHTTGFVSQKIPNKTITVNFTR